MPANPPAPASPMKTTRLYREVANRLAAQIANGTYRIGERLPAERELAQSFAVSRPTIREAMIALEIAGQVEIRTGAGIFVASTKPQPQASMLDDIGPGPFELTEARAAFEGEAAALAATRISEGELQELEKACREMSASIERGESAEEADQRFHRIIAEATRNSTVEAAVNYMWTLRTRMPMWKKLHQVISELEGKPGWNNDSHTIMDHRRILNALRARDADGARQAMRSHLDHVKENLLKASELDAIDMSATPLTKTSDIK